ncbi:MAG: response regulator [Candidatus Omnitrophica bacterium]|nr:response regulator [Candidatus Omnitrophota bacterium]
MPKLLIVDDEKDVREFSKNFFRKRSVDSLTASGGIEALALIALEKPDLILLDVRMGEMSGIDVLRVLRKEGSLVRVVMISGMNDEEVVKEAASLGAIGFIHKPLVLEELERVVLAELNKAHVNC